VRTLELAGLQREVAGGLDKGASGSLHLVRDRDRDRVKVSTCAAAPRCRECVHVSTRAVSRACVAGLGLGLWVRFRVRVRVS
jgi:hypothetical protein